MGILSDFVRLTIECIVQSLRDDPLQFAGAALAGVAVGGLSWAACYFWASLWNTSYKMTRLHPVLAIATLALAAVGSITIFALKEAAVIVQSQIQNWESEINNDQELKSRLRRQLYDKISAQGLEDMGGIPDPRSLAPGQRWELIYKSKETQLLAGEVYTPGTLQSFAIAHPLLFAIFYLNMAPDLVASEIRIKTNASHVYCMDDAAKLIAAAMSEKLEAQILIGVLATRAICAAAFVVWMCVPLTAVAISAYKDIKVHTLKGD